MAKRMTHPVQCGRCSAIYDFAGEYEIVARYADCTVFKTPCCGAIVDDRPWKSLPDFERLEPDAVEVLVRDGERLRRDGNVIRVVSMTGRRLTQG
jgi:hypothetical protein